MIKIIEVMIIIACFTTIMLILGPRAYKIYNRIDTNLTKFGEHLMKLAYYIKINTVVSEVLYFIRINKLISVLLIGAIFVINKNCIDTNISKISFAYITSLIFYIVAQYIPNRKVSKNAYDLIQHNLTSIFSAMSNIISIIDFAFKYHSEELGIRFDDKFYYCNKSYYSNGRLITHVGGNGYNMYKDLYREYVTIQKGIEKVLSTPYISLYNSKLLIILTNILNCEMLQRIVFDKRKFDIDKELNCLGVGYFLNEKYCSVFNDFQKFYNELNEFSFSKLTYKYELMNEKQIQHAKDFRRYCEQHNSNTLKAMDIYRKKYFYND